jgi:hypothetical protein
MISELKPRRSIFLPLLFFFIAAAIGNLIGGLFGSIVTGGILYDIFTAGFPIGLDKMSLSLGTWNFELGFNFDLNFFGLLFMFIFVLIYKKV